MKRYFSSFIGILLSLVPLLAQEVSVAEARFTTKDSMAFKEPGYDDSAWQILSLEREWDLQGIRHYKSFAWYRIHAVIPSSMKKGVTDKILLDIGPVDDVDETYLNGHFVGKTGTTPFDPEGYQGEWQVPRKYIVPASWVNWDGENVIAVRVYNSDGEGGFYAGAARIVKPMLGDFVKMNVEREGMDVKLDLSSAIKTSGTLEVELTDILTGAPASGQTKKLRLTPGKPFGMTIPAGERKRVDISYRDVKFDETLSASTSTPYILTPPAPEEPRYNGPAVFGVRPGSPVIFRLPFSGNRPMKYAVKGLPEGVTLDAEKGILGGTAPGEGEYPLVLTATNDKGQASASFTLVVGDDKIALTPPMGWNSWNCWGTSVSQEKVMQSAAALINRGLADYGYSYINIDDAWEADERAADGTILTNDKFPDMKGLGDWLHANGLKMGIYSSPGDRTCGGYLGTIGHEEQDAATWNEWGVDYLKYDWCGYDKVFKAQKDRSNAAYMRPYLKMQEYLRKQPRDIFYSLCQYGMSDVWEWGRFVDANSWRTTGDIVDTWESLYDIGFVRQRELYPYAGPGHWNDPDMMVVGKVGWGPTLHDSRLTPDEQYTHISLWSLLAANILIGCPIEQIDDFTFNLLCNNEVNAVHQDVQGSQAQCLVDEDNVQIWARDLSDGGKAVGIFNLNDAPMPALLRGCLEKIGIVKGTVRDLWRQKDIPTDEVYTIQPHGVIYIKIK